MKKTAKKKAELGVIGQQGEVRITRIASLPTDHVSRAGIERDGLGRYIISHSERGHHHVLDGGDVMEATYNVPNGMKIFYAILEKPATFSQSAHNPHGSYALEPGCYEFRVSREFDPFADLYRTVVD